MLRACCGFVAPLALLEDAEGYKCWQVKEIMTICSDLTEEEALCALKLHKER